MNDINSLSNDYILTMNDINSLSNDLAKLFVCFLTFLLSISLGTISVKVLPPISTEGLTKDDVTELTLKCQQSMEEVFMKDFAERKDEFVNVAPLPRDLQIPSMRKKYN